MSRGSAIVSDALFRCAVNSVGAFIMTTRFCSSTFIMSGGATLGPFRKISAGTTSKGADSFPMCSGCLVKNVNAGHDATNMSSPEGCEDLGVGPGESSRAGSINLAWVEFIGVWLAACFAVG